MSTLTSASTLAQVRAAYMDGASYAEDASPSKCKAFITACRFLLLMMPKRASHGGRQGEEIEIDPSVIQEEKEAAENWLSGNDPTGSGSAGGGIVHVDFNGFRE